MSELDWQSHHAAKLRGRDDQAGGTVERVPEGITSTTKRGNACRLPALAGENNDEGKKK